MAGARASRQAGLPDREIVYQDTVDSGAMVPTLVSHLHGLVGRPDYLIESDQALVPVELKSSRCPARGPFENHVPQLMGYCLLVEDSMGKPVPEGILRYQDREVRVPFTQQKRDWVLGIILAVRAAKGGRPVGRSHQLPQKCRTASPSTLRLLAACATSVRRRVDTCRANPSGRSLSSRMRTATLSYKGRRQQDGRAETEHGQNRWKRRRGAPHCGWCFGKHWGETGGTPGGWFRKFWVKTGNSMRWRGRGVRPGNRRVFVF
jgi:hypothetical protein